MWSFKVYLEPLHFLYKEKGQTDKLQKVFRCSRKNVFRCSRKKPKVFRCSRKKEMKLSKKNRPREKNKMK